MVIGIASITEGRQNFVANLSRHLIVRLPYIAFANIVVNKARNSMENEALNGALIPPEQIDDFVILRARKFTSSIRRALTHDVLQAENLPVLEWQLLFSIARFGSCHVAFVTKHTSIDPAHGSRAASALEKKGLIDRCEDPKNRRRKLMSLTPAGKETFARIWPKARQITARAAERLIPEDFREFKRLLDLINGVDAPSKTDCYHGGVKKTT